MLPREYASDDNKLYSKMNFYVSVHPQRDLFKATNFKRECHGAQYDKQIGGAILFVAFFRFRGIRNHQRNYWSSFRMVSLKRTFWRLSIYSRQKPYHSRCIPLVNTGIQREDAGISGLV